MIMWSRKHDDHCVSLAVEMLKDGGMTKSEKSRLRQIIERGGCNSLEEGEWLDALYHDFTEVLE